MDKRVPEEILREENHRLKNELSTCKSDLRALRRLVTKVANDPTSRYTEEAGALLEGIP